MIDFWQNIPAHLNPIAFNLGPIQVSWYGIMYLVAFTLVYYLVRYRIRTEKLSISFEAVQEFFPWLIISLLLGARIGDVLIYDWGYFQNHVSQIFLPFDVHNHWQYIGIYGMSYFGGLVGIILAFWIFCRAKKIPLLEFSDLFAPVVPLAYAFGRLGNFINGELYGRVTKVPWGMYFPLDITNQLRHPSQLYEMFLEGILLFAILWLLRSSPFVKGRPRGILTALYLIGYGFARAAAEFFRQPDNNWFFLSITIGQWFSVGIVILGFFLIIKNRAARREAL